MPRIVVSNSQIKKIAMEAVDRANSKGMDHHGMGGLVVFTEQPVFQILETVGVGFAHGQALKKIHQAIHGHDIERDTAELMDAIVYLAAAWMTSDLPKWRSLDTHDTPTESLRAAIDGLMDTREEFANCLHRSEGVQDLIGAHGVLSSAIRGVSVLPSHGSGNGRAVANVVADIAESIAVMRRHHAKNGE